MKMTSSYRVVFVVLLTTMTTTTTTMTSRPTAFCLNKMLPGELIDYEYLNAPSHCACRVMCQLNMSCKGLSAGMNDNGKTDCFFSNVKIPLEQLLADQKSNSWIHEVDGSTAAADYYDQQPPATTASGPTSLTRTTIHATPPTSSTTHAMSASSPTSTTTHAMSTSSPSSSTTHAMSTSSPTITTTHAMSTSSPASSTTTTAAATTTASTSSTTTPEPNCKGWKEFQDTCYLFLEGPKTWLEAEENCKSLNGHLAKVPTEKELDFITGSFEGNAWIGLNDRDEHGTYIWISDNSSISINDENSDKLWYEGEPNSRNERCIVLWNRFFHDLGCEEKVGFVCEKTPSP